MEFSVLLQHEFNTFFTQMQINNIRRFLPHKFAAIIAEELSVSESLVYSVLNGSRENIKVAEALIRLAQNHKEKLREIEERAGKI